MNKGLRTQLQTLTDVDLYELHKAVGIAVKTRSLMHEFDLSPDELCKGLGINKSKFIDFINGSYPYTLMDLAKIEVLGKELYIKRAKEEAQG